MVEPIKNNKAGEMLRSIQVMGKNDRKRTHTKTNDTGQGIIKITERLFA
jgi:hypothetical protein